MKNKKKLFIVVGKTSTSKDTVCNYLKEEYGIKQVISYSSSTIQMSDKDNCSACKCNANRNEMY